MKSDIGIGGPNRRFLLAMAATALFAFGAVQPGEAAEPLKVGTSETGARSMLIP